MASKADVEKWIRDNESLEELEQMQQAIQTRISNLVQAQQTAKPQGLGAKIGDLVDALGKMAKKQEEMHKDILSQRPKPSGKSGKAQKARPAKPK